MLRVPACYGTNCEKRKDCYRYMQITDSMSTFYEFENVCKAPKYQHIYSIEGKELRKEAIENKENKEEVKEIKDNPIESQNN